MILEKGELVGITVPGERISISPIDAWLELLVKVIVISPLAGVEPCVTCVITRSVKVNPLYPFNENQSFELVSDEMLWVSIGVVPKSFRRTALKVESLLETIFAEFIFNNIYFISIIKFT